jgi:multiple antibiotic resistance protein
MMTLEPALFRFAVTTFVTLIVVIDPFALVPVFVSMTKDYTMLQRRTILKRALWIAFGVALFFLLAGKLLLTYLGVSVSAFSISGGILLFLTAMPMLFGHRGLMMSPTHEEERHEASDIAVFPLAIPLISGPGTLTSILTLDAAAKGSLAYETVIVAGLAVVFLITAFLMRYGTAVVLRMGQGSVNVGTRVLGILLAALAAQFVLSGISGFAHGLR